MRIILTQAFLLTAPPVCTILAFSLAILTLETGLAITKTVHVVARGAVVTTTFFQTILAPFFFGTFRIAVNAVVTLTEEKTEKSIK